LWLVSLDLPECYLGSFGWWTSIGRSLMEQMIRLTVLASQSVCNFFSSHAFSFLPNVQQLGMTKNVLQTPV
jgi:hypothetical protein